MAVKLKAYSVLDKFKFERKPVGVKFMITKPDGIKRLDGFVLKFILRSDSDVRI